MRAGQVVTGRDPFARQTVRRRREQSSVGCHWCGSVEKRLWAYYVERDDRSGKHFLAEGRAFCNVGCMRSWLC